MKQKFVVTALLLLVCGKAWGLEADEVALIVNKRVPGGRVVAERYVKERGVPEGRIIEVELPVGEDCSFEEFEAVVPVVRGFLREHKLEGKVRCLVPVYGVPIRIREHELTAAEREEREAAKKELEVVRGEVVRLVKGVEKLAGEADAGFTAAGTGTSIAELAKRGDEGMKAVVRRMGESTDQAERQKLMQGVMGFIGGMGGQMGVWERVGPGMLAQPNVSAEQRAKLEKTKADAARVQAEARALADKRHDPAARGAVLKMLKANFGALACARQLEGVVGYLADEDTVAAFDSELALLWWGLYERGRWQPNPLYYGIEVAGAPPVVMTCRLDGPEAGTGVEILLASLKAEREGLKGRLVMDARGKRAEAGKPPDAYAAYDESIRRLAGMMKGNARVPVTFDDEEKLLPEKAGKEVAMYVGWYSVGNYVPCCEFVPGAVGFHVASFEMTSLRDEGNRGWCRGLLKDGVAATLGPVAEPYLHAFPAADDFFGLLMTGKLTLAEVYWRTNLMTSWRMCLIGDPLYTPFKKEAAVGVEGLPERLRGAVGKEWVGWGTTRPSTTRAAE